MSGRPVALVTGAAKNLGAAIARRLGAEGYAVAVHFRASVLEAEAVADAVRRAGGEAACFRADLTAPEGPEGLAAAVLAHYGRLDALVHNVGDYHEESVLTAPVAAWKAMFASNLFSVVELTQAAWPALSRSPRGRVVTVGYASTGRVVANVNATAYAAAKNAVLTYTKSLAAAAGGLPLTANMISPGVLETSITYPPLKAVPKGRWGRPDELAGAVAYFCSSEADYVTGQHLEIAGGWKL